jgi:hypothetical protein
MPVTQAVRRELYRQFDGRIDVLLWYAYFELTCIQSGGGGTSLALGFINIFTVSQEQWLLVRIRVNICD